MVQAAPLSAGLCWDTFPQVTKGHSLSSNASPWTSPEASFHLHNVCSQPALRIDPMGVLISYLDQDFSKLLCCHFCTQCRRASLT